MKAILTKLAMEKSVPLFSAILPMVENLVFLVDESPELQGQIDSAFREVAALYAAEGNELWSG